MLQGEFYGTRASDKQLAGHGGRKVSPASRYVGRAVAVPVDMDAPKSKTTRRKRTTTPSPEPTTPTTDATSPSNDNTGAAITEDDLFG